jgi:putative membrane protein
MMNFTEQDRMAIRAAVEAAESRARGEIVPMVVPASALYRDASHLAGLIMALLALALLVAFDYGWRSWHWSGGHPGWSVIIVLAAYALGSVAGRRPAVIRSLTPQDRMKRKVELRAQRAFYEQGLHKTREGTGILILLSLLEHRVQILADRAIDERVPSGTWDALVDDLVRGIQGGREIETMCRVIATCGDLLALHFPAREGDNPNELSDDLIRGA